MSEHRKHKTDENFMMKVAAFIVDKRNLFFLIVILGFIFSLFSTSWVQVENALAAYLPDNSESRHGLDIMEDPFVTYGTAQVMVANISLNEAKLLHEALSDLDGVQSITFTDTEHHYKNASALYMITFDDPETDAACEESLGEVEAYLEGYDYYVVTSLGNALAENLDAEVKVIIVHVAIIVVAVLIFTTQTYAEIPVLLLTFVTAMILNGGTNFLLGKISFISNSVTNVLQLALSLDYAVILSNRYKEEHERLPVREAAIVALSKAIPEISASSLTTIGGLIAMMFMQFKIGPDMAICLIKSILFALLAVFVVMPGLLVLFAPLMEKTQHKSFIPRIDFVGKFNYATRFIVPPIFIAIIVVAFGFSNNCPYTYGTADMTPPKLNDTLIAENMVTDNFGATNFVAVVVPKGNYETEKRFLAELDTYEEIDYSMGLSNVEAMDGYTAGGAGGAIQSNISAMKSYIGSAQNAVAALKPGEEPSLPDLGSLGQLVSAVRVMKDTAQQMVNTVSNGTGAVVSSVTAVGDQVGAIAETVSAIVGGAKQAPIVDSSDAALEEETREKFLAASIPATFKAISILVVLLAPWRWNTR